MTIATKAKRARKSTAKVIVENNDAVITAAIAAIEGDAVETAENAPATIEVTADDVDAVLATIIDDTTSEPVEHVATLRDNALSCDDDAITAMVADIGVCFLQRDVFENSQGLDVTAVNSYTKARADCLKHNDKLARLFIALNVSASNVILRKVQHNAMFNAKALHKVVEIARYVCGDRTRVQLVTRAFIACSIIATRKGVEVLTNDVNKRFLNNASFGSLIRDRELVDNLADMRHKYMSGGADTQSSQARNVLDVLGIASIMTSTSARDSIKLHNDHAFVELFASDYLVTAS